MDPAHAPQHRGQAAADHGRVSDQDPVLQLPGVYLPGPQGQGRPGHLHQPHPPLQTGQGGGPVLLPIQVGDRKSNGLELKFDVGRSKGDLPQHTGWTFFDLGAEFARQGLPNNSWVNCSINLEWRICPSYPSLVMVPATATSALVVGSAKFRSKGRLPVLTYYHGATGAALVRCSQPLSGLKGNNTILLRRHEIV